MKNPDFQRPVVSAVIVSHNSERTIERCLRGLLEQDYMLESIVVVDSGSKSREYLQSFSNIDSVQLLFSGNVGFSRANNLGLEKVPAATEFVVFVNPDLFLPVDFVSKAVGISLAERNAGIVSGRLLGYDLEGEKASGLLDSTGIKRKWYGRWYDRGQGEIDVGQYGAVEYMPALCGALLFCRCEALHPYTGFIFDPEFFLYKEDIELCLRLRKNGWKLLYHPDLVALHCRGWENERQKMSYELRLLAAKSEILLYKKHPSLYMFWALVKYGLVKVFRL